ncbi:phosphatidylinositol N-acetylglucosaminyltransferase subunit P-like isoform X1 [Ostrea edulis]|uniref:phosphatidylinositol N-acetylglucosaminyltransferase subunit P-like isoform X1 n=1 Tax=Ostrea edulis TaxID=37623 RepID=UPI0024AF3FFA|nr:phosphatidylinositol N-acetylglucosaminyltransferase subunit P-like isoform X1 [Ostrea edulis]
MIAMTSRSTPSPVPDRATYGFVSYLLCYILFGIFLIWTYIPRTYLEGIGLTYWPSKFTAVSIPPFLCVLFLVYNILYEGLIFINTAPFQSLDTISGQQGHVNHIGLETSPHHVNSCSVIMLGSFEIFHEKKD